VRTAVLVDRCISRQPVHADIVGLRLQVAAGDVIECNVPPYEEQFRIELLRRS
jgi:pyrimidine operon attenuation protein/uracil phosphoribosyltransferase